jgi:hypothetical protein
MRRNFWILSQSYFALSEALRDAKHIDRGGDEIVFGLYNARGETTGEFVIRWEPHGPSESLARLDAPFGTWAAMKAFDDVFEGLAALERKKKSPSVAAVAKLLVDCGLHDVTQRVDPASGKSTARRRAGPA